MADDMEESRTASLGRKRRNNQSAVNNTTHHAGKRRKVEDNVDFIALDSDSEAQSESESDHAPAHASSQQNPITIDSDREDDRESGEVSDSAAGYSRRSSRRSSRASVLSATTSSHDVVPQARRPPMESPPDHGNNVDIDLVFPDNLRKFVREQMKSTERSAIEVLNDMLQPNRQLRRPAQGFLRCWREGYKPTFGDLHFSDLKSMLADRQAFTDPLDMGMLPRPDPGYKPPKAHGVLTTFEVEYSEQHERFARSNATELLLKLLRTLQYHKSACKVLREYIDKCYRPEKKTAAEEAFTNAQYESETNLAVANSSFSESKLPAFDSRARVSDLSEGEQELQKRYYGLAEDDMANCLCCGQSGHLQQACPARACNHCKSTTHMSHRCPSRRNTDLTKPPCVFCGDQWHAAEMCSSVWRTFHPRPDAVRKIPAEHMVAVCYNCGNDPGKKGKGVPHWGDDCPNLPRFVAEILTHDTWSSKNAARYIIDEDELSQDDGDMNGDDKPLNGGGSVQAHQLAQMADWG